MLFLYININTKTLAATRIHAARGFRWARDGATSHKVQFTFFVSKRLVMVLRDYGAAEVMPVFKKLLPRTYVDQLLDNTSKKFYERIFTPIVLLWGLIYQRLSSDHTYDEVVAHIKSGTADHLSVDPAKPISARLHSESTAAYSKGRQRFPLDVLQQTMTYSAQQVQQRVSSWHGHPVSLIDGSTFMMRPTESLIAHYGVQTNQHGTNYWMVLRGVAAFCLRTGVVTAFAQGPYKTSEQKLALQVITAAANTVFVGDSNFGIFSIVQAARHAQSHVVVRLTDVRAHKIAGRPLQPGDDVEVHWTPSRQDQLNDDMSAEPIHGRVLYCRVEFENFPAIDLYLFTTLLERSLYTPEELTKLYGFRLHAELNLRYVKEQLELGELKGKSPDSVRKELYSGLLTYNLIRGSMVEAAGEANLSPLHLSFTSCWRRLRSASTIIQATEHPERITEILVHLISRLGLCKLPQRKIQRFEPRLVRPRPRPYRFLKGDRQQARKEYIQQLQRAG